MNEKKSQWNEKKPTNFQVLKQLCWTNIWKMYFNFMSQNHHIYCKTAKHSDNQKNYSSYPKIWLIWIFHSVMHPEDVDGIANSVDPDQTAPLRAVWSGSTLFAQAYLSENLKSLQ